MVPWELIPVEQITVVWRPTGDEMTVNIRSVVYCRSDSTFKVERCPFYKGDSVEFSTDFS